MAKLGDPKYGKKASAGIAPSGDVCPVCGKRLKPLSAAERQRRYRARKAAEKS